jgi:predicted deacylase
VQAPLLIAKTDVAPGSVARIELPVARLFTQQMLRLPIVAINGAADGPRLSITAAIHGDEIVGTEIARRVIAAVDVRKLRGALVVVPVVNVWGFLEMSRYLPDRRDLNRSFPGSPKGSLAAQIAYLLMTEVVGLCTHGVDLHAGSAHRTNLPQIRADFDLKGVESMAHAFAAPAAIHGKLRSGSLRAAASKRGMPCVLYEAGSTLRMEAEAVQVGTDGVLRVMQSLDMIDEAPEAKAASFLSRQTSWIRAPRAGIASLTVRPGDHVEKGSVIGVTRDTWGDQTARIKTRHAGLVIGMTENPLVNRGDALVHVAEPA